MPTELHLALQQHYAGADGEIEVDLGRYRADVLRGGVIYEVQTGNFTAIRDKVKSLARKHSVVVVYPVPRDKLIVHIDPETGDELRARKSPKHGRPIDIFEHLVAAAPQFGLRVFQQPTGADFRLLTESA
mgnify:CR=1 FL=1